MRNVTVAAIQMNSTWDCVENLEKAKQFVIEAAKDGAQIILLPELFEHPYFCQIQNEHYFDFAQPMDQNPAVKEFQKIAKEYEVVLPISFYERANQVLFNTVAVIDADGTILGRYRKSHIPTGPQYMEKLYFSPGDTGFLVWNTKYAKIGVAICWDQYSNEAARIMALKGAEMIFYPSAVGKDKYVEDSSPAPWQNVMRGHAASNMIPVIAANHVGLEVNEGGKQYSEIDFFGAAFIAGETGEKVAEADGETEGYIKASFNLDFLLSKRTSYSLFMDRRPELYGDIIKKDATEVKFQ